MEHPRNFPPKKPSIDAEVQFHLGVQLRRLFAETAHQSVPERFASLLDRLQSGENSGRGGGEYRGAPQQLGDAERMNEAKR